MAKQPDRTDKSPSLRVECDAGHRAEAEPRRLSLGDRTVDVTEIIHGWVDPPCSLLTGATPRRCPKPTEDSAQMPRGKPLVAEIGTLTQDTRLVGHLPFLGRPASGLPPSDPERVDLALQPASLACLEWDPTGLWAFARMVRPELVRPAGD